MLIFSLSVFIFADWHAKLTKKWYEFIKVDWLTEFQIKVLSRILITPMIVLSAYFLIKHIVTWIKK